MIPGLQWCDTHPVIGKPPIKIYYKSGKSVCVCLSAIEKFEVVQHDRRTKIIDQTCRFRLVSLETSQFAVDSEQKKKLEFAALSALCHWGFDSCARQEIERWKEFILQSQVGGTYSTWVVLGAGNQKR